MCDFGYVLATKLIVGKKLPVRYMYREIQQGGDSGWRFFAGLEDQAYVDNPENIGVYDIQTILDIDDSVRPYINAEPGTAFVRDIHGRWGQAASCKIPSEEQKSKERDE